MIERFDIDIAGGIERFVLDQIDDEITFTDRQLRAALAQAGAADNLEQLDTVRELLRDGWRYDETDLRQELDRRGDLSAATIDKILSVNPKRAFAALG